MPNKALTSASNDEPIADYEFATYQKIGLALAPLVAITMLVFSEHQTLMPLDAWKVAALAIWMAIWWATEAIPVPATAFMPLVFLPFMGIKPISDAAASYANPIIYLFLGAFLLAIAIERWQLHKRIALSILLITGTNGVRLIAGFMGVTALLSMWMTNTSTTMMLMPIALSIAKVVVENNPQLDVRQRNDFKKAMLLSIAFAATIGGMGTIIGTPPNALLAAFMKENYEIAITFATWMMVGVPLMCAMLPIAWWVLTKLAFKVEIPNSPAAIDFLKTQKLQLGSMTTAEKRVAILFALVVFAWMLRKPLSNYLGLNNLSDAGIAMTAALLLFVIPSGMPKTNALLSWDEVSKLPWGVLILFGGGLSLAAAVSYSGLAQWLGYVIAPIGGIGIFALIIAATAMVIFLTELTSNLATTATFLPVVASVALELNISPLILCIPVTLAASCAFMLPVATAPNAIVFSTGVMKIPDMAKAGVLLNLMGLVILSFIAVYLAPFVFN